MKYLEYEVKNMTISKAQGEKTRLVSGAKNYFGLHFTFDEEFSAIAGTKVVEFYKNRKNTKRDLVGGSCAIPNDFISDKSPFEIRVVCGNTVATPWLSVTIEESGTITPEEPEEELTETMDYVKTLVGDEAVAMLRKGASGLEYSQNGEDWESGISGIPDVPKTPKDAMYLRKNGDWVQYEAPETPNVEGLTGTAKAVEKLADDADLTAVVAKVNEIVDILKERGITA